ncbi:MAG: RecQ family ATP-dependent DNA helicase [Patescibacteria group bacterium]
MDKKQALLQLLNIHFSYTSFRPGQEEAIDSVLAGKNTIVVMPTGGGKSLIFQLTALVLDGVTIVVSPLISLMKDQVDSLTQVGIPATFINSSISQAEVDARLAQVKSGEFKIIYIAPERFYNQSFMESLRSFKVALFAIDEAHCISQWGHDFRPSYLKLHQAIKSVNNPPVVALTATATPEVRDDIVKQLHLDSPTMIVTGFARPNLQFGVASLNDRAKIDMIVDFVRSAPSQSGIVYVGTRGKADELVDILTGYDVSAVTYHAGMDPESREWVQNSFMAGEAQVVVATNAFGLGINKKDIRFVIHHDLPGTIEAYYQEAGRAGRDGETSFCLLLYSPRDRYLREFFIKGDNPGAHIILEIYDFLRRRADEQPGESILITYSELGKKLSESVPEMAIGTSLKILEREGYISRPNEKTANAFLQAKSDFVTMSGSLGKRAKTQIEVFEKLIERFGKELQKGWEISLEEVASILKVKKESLLRMIKKLDEQGFLEYRPPFRGTEIKVLKSVHPADLNLDFSALKAKESRAYDKLDEMESYVYSQSCRQQYILNYFGDHNSQKCGQCDVCLKKGPTVKETSYLGDY